MGNRVFFDATGRPWKLLCLGLAVTNILLLATLFNRGVRLRPRLENEPFAVAGKLPVGVVYGNARHDGARTKNWILGHFMPPASGRRFSDVEIKYSHKHAGDRNGGNGEVATNAVAHTLSMLISGKVQVEFPDCNVTLERLGDYTIWKPGVPHSWTTLEDAVILAIRWPSIPNDQTARATFE